MLAHRNNKKEKSADFSDCMGIEIQNIIYVIVRVSLLYLKEYVTGKEHRFTMGNTNKHAYKLKAPKRFLFIMFLCASTSLYLGL